MLPRTYIVFKNLRNKTSPPPQLPTPHISTLTKTFQAVPNYASRASLLNLAVTCPPGFCPIFVYNEEKIWWVRKGEELAQREVHETARAPNPSLSGVLGRSSEHISVVWQKSWKGKLGEAAMVLNHGGLRVNLLLQHNLVLSWLIIRVILTFGSKPLWESYKN